MEIFEEQDKMFYKKRFDEKEMFYEHFEEQDKIYVRFTAQEINKPCYCLSWYIVDNVHSYDDYYDEVIIEQDDRTIVSLYGDFRTRDFQNAVRGKILAYLVDDIMTHPLKFSVRKGKRSVSVTYPEQPSVINPERPMEILSFYAIPSSHYKSDQDKSVTLYWKIIDADSAILSDGKTERSVDLEDSITVQLEETTTFSLKAFKGNYWTKERCLKVEVKNKQQTEFYAQPISDQPGSFLLKWHVKDANWVYLDDEKVQFEGERIIEVKEEKTITLKVRDDIRVALYPIKLFPTSSFHILPRFNK